MLAQLVSKAGLGRVGMRDHFEAHHKRPLSDHLIDFRSEHSSRGNAPAYVEMVIARLRSVLDGCGFVYIRDISASRVADWLADLRRTARKPRSELPAGKVLFTSKEAGELLGIKPESFRTVVYRNRLAAQGKGKARRFPRATVVA